MNGVNLGGWLVLERWMTPSLFKGTDAEDEYSFMYTADAARKIKKHRETFITEEDWKWLSSHDIRFVRLPVGYWVLKNDGPFIEARSHLDWAFKMAEKYNIKILLDLHGLKGSQNGEMHSGKKGKVDWWRYRHETLATLRELAARFKNSPALWGMEIINEPKVVGNYFRLLWYYRKAYTLLRTVLKPGTYTVFHDGFVSPIFTGALWARKGYPVALDSHFYLVGARLLSKLTPQKYDVVRGILYRMLITVSSWCQPVIIGEWGAVLLQPMFNREPQDKHLAMLGMTIERQRSMYKKALATAFWNYKAEGEGMYHYRSLVDNEIVYSK